MDKLPQVDDLSPSNKELYALIAQKVKCMGMKQKLKILKKRSAMKKLIAEAKEELENGRTTTN